MRHSTMQDSDHWNTGAAGASEKRHEYQRAGEGLSRWKGMPAVHTTRIRFRRDRIMVNATPSTVSAEARN